MAIEVWDYGSGGDGQGQVIVKEAGEKIGVLRGPAPFGYGVIPVWT